jgi:hypothetical protein
MPIRKETLRAHIELVFNKNDIKEKILTKKCFFSHGCKLNAFNFCNSSIRYSLRNDLVLGHFLFKYWSLSVFSDPANILAQCFLHLIQNGIYRTVA